MLEFDDDIAASHRRQPVGNEQNRQLPVQPSMASITDCSVALSRALVASSKTRMLARLYKARAMPIRCRWPPDRRMPRSPTNAS